MINKMISGSKFFEDLDQFQVAQKTSLIITEIYEREKKQ